MHSKLHKLFSNHSENEKLKFSAFLPLKLLFPLPCWNLNTQNIFKRNIYILVFETIQNIFSLSCFPLHPHKSMSLATEIVFLSKKTKPCFSQRQN